MTVHLHGTPITPRSELLSLAGRSFCVSFADPRDVEVCHEIGEQVMLDSGAFTIWKRGGTLDLDGYYAFCRRWVGQTTWAVIPDVIDGTAEENDRLLVEWYTRKIPHGAPVWHMNESLERLLRLTLGYDRVCIGSSGEYAALKTPEWHRRMSEAMDVACVDGVPRCWLHMLRGMAAVDDRYPFASVDSTDVARNHNLPHHTARMIAERWDGRQCPRRWLCSGKQLELAA